MTVSLEPIGVTGLTLAQANGIKIDKMRDINRLGVIGKINGIIMIIMLDRSASEGVLY